ncbi:GlsB/YeaQ/YmgE family stress response membrane protein [Aurantiacibacter aquimixticola]|uniref:GlsB/YeaQ/YmgE family stress response membrane protein n=1 Tax=Aurantiacibacter aquimixticola TaxID=1958945 RepID=A0A419RX08_9SPHN|nr:GlsB/YeaQ/YmgE family stress response membrane protein [Aurantiacibacter aquimixticola]RJY10328.1 GlsB/YeaQ/YmgE family stress response membrane protein [Aurantiacibacter aquimixticola]
MGWIATIIIGGIAGWLASMVMNRNASMGIFWNIVVGVIGGVIGGFLGAQTGLIGEGGWLTYLIWATIGAVVLLAIVNLVQRGRVR